MVGKLKLFFLVERAYFDCFDKWVNYLRMEKLFSNEDALYPKPKRCLMEGGSKFDRMWRNYYWNASAIRVIIREAFTSVQLPAYTPHLFRKTLAMYGNTVCNTMEEVKAWSMNLGHEHIATTVSAYMPVSQQRQCELIKSLKFTFDCLLSVHCIMTAHSYQACFRTKPAVHLTCCIPSNLKGLA